MFASIKSKSRGLLIAGAALLSLLSIDARAAETQSVRDGDYSSLSSGELKSVALTSDGYLMPTYARSAAADTGNEIVWDAVREKSGSILAATGHHGRLVRLRDNKTTQTLGSFHESELTALLKLRDGSILIAGAPTGRIYRLGTDDKITTFAQTKASFVWRMAQDDNGAIWLATGSKGQLLRITPKRGNDAGEANVETMLDFQSTNLLDLWIDAQGQFGAKGMIYVAGQNPGWLYRFDPSTKKAEVVYNSQAEEVRSILPLGKVLALALNTERAPTPQALQLTLRMAGGSVSPAAGGRGRGAGPAGASGGDAGNSDALRLLADALSGGRGGTNVGPPRSGVVLLNPNGYTRTLWASSERPISSLALSPTGNILASAGENGRLFEISENGTYSLVADLREDYLVRIVSDDQGYLLTSARNGTVTRMERRRAQEATFISRPIDAGTPSHWGKYYFSGSIGKGQSVDVAFRTGNDGDPDSKLWSEWSHDAHAPNHEPVAMPDNVARFVQYRLTLHQGAGDAAPVRMDTSELFFAGVNAAPIVLAFDISESNSPAAGRGGLAAAAAAAAGGRGGAPGGIMGAPSLPGGGGSSGGSGERSESGRSAHSNAMNFNVTWRVLDPNTDALNYALYYRAVDEKEWKLIDDKLTETHLPLDVSGIADGRYRLRLVVTDQPGNPPGQGLTTEKISDEFTVDNTPPRFGTASARAEGKHSVLTFAVDDDLSLISSVKIDFDNNDSTPAVPKDGLLDDRHEDFEVATPDMKPGEHVATIEATDRAGNSTVTKLIFVNP